MGVCCWRGCRLLQRISKLLHIHARAVVDQILRPSKFWRASSRGWSHTAAELGSELAPFTLPNAVRICTKRCVHRRQSRRAETVAGDIRGVEPDMYHARDLQQSDSSLAMFACDSS